MKTINLKWNIVSSEIHNTNQMIIIDFWAIQDRSLDKLTVPR